MKNFSKKQQKAILVFRKLGNTTPEAAKAAGVTTRTIYRWMHDPEFQAARAEAIAEAFEDWKRSLGLGRR